MLTMRRAITIGKEKRTNYFGVPLLRNYFWRTNGMGRWPEGIGTIISDASDVLVQGSPDLSDVVRDELCIVPTPSKTSVRKFLNDYYGTNKHFAVDIMALLLDLSGTSLNEYSGRPQDDSWLNLAQRVFTRLDTQVQSGIVRAVDQYIHKTYTDILPTSGSLGDGLLKPLESMVSHAKSIASNVRSAADIIELLSIAYNLSLIKNNRAFYEPRELVEDLGKIALVSSATSALPIGFTLAKTIQDVPGTSLTTISYITNLSEGVNGVYISWQIGQESNDILILGLDDFSGANKSEHIKVIRECAPRLVSEKGYRPGFGYVTLITDSLEDIRQWRLELPKKNIVDDIQIRERDDASTYLFHQRFKNPHEFLKYQESKRQRWEFAKTRGLDYGRIYDALIRLERYIDNPTVFTLLEDNTISKIIMDFYYGLDNGLITYQDIRWAITEGRTITALRARHGMSWFGFDSPQFEDFVYGLRKGLVAPEQYQYFKTRFELDREKLDELNRREIAQYLLRRSQPNPNNPPSS